MYRLPGTVNYGNFPQANKNGSIFFSKAEFDFVANDVSFNSLLAETCNSMQITPPMLDQQLTMFKNSVNRDPDIFRVPEDGGDPFFKKLNLGLFLKNYSAKSDPIHTKASNVIDFMVAGFTNLTSSEGDAAKKKADEAMILAFAAKPFGPAKDKTITPAAAIDEINKLTTAELQRGIVATEAIYRAGGNPRGSPDTDVQKLVNIFGLVVSDWWTIANASDPDRLIPVIWAGTDTNQFDELKVFVYNMYPTVKNALGAELNQQLGRASGKYNHASGVLQANATDILMNLGERLRRDAFYRERNFKEVLQEVGVSVEEFERLVENAVSVIYWPDCIASKVSDQDLYNLVKGFGLPVESLQGKSKSEICSFILTSLGFRPQHFGTKPGPVLDDVLGSESVQLLRKIVMAIRDPRIPTIPEGYLGFNAVDLDDSTTGYAEGINGAYLMTGFAAHNVTAEKAARWLQATGVDASTQAGFLSYVGNENMFDIMDKRKDMRKINFTGNMDYTKTMLDNKLERNGEIGLWYQ